MERLNLCDIITDGMQMRAETRQEVVEEYAALYEEGAKFPPVRVMRDGQGRNWLVDGFHRVAAARRLGKVRIRAEVESGSRTDAMWAACGANSSHGLPMSNEDKRKAVTFALELHPEMSDENIARHVGVTRMTVVRYRRKLVFPPMPIPPGEVAGADGQVVTMLQPATLPQRPSGCNNVTACGDGHPVTMLQPAAAPSEPPKRPQVDGTPIVRGVSYPIMPPRKTGVDGKSYPVPSPAPERQVDANGREIPPDALDSWNGRKELPALARQISAIRVAARKAQDERDALWQGVTISSLLTHLDAAFDLLSAGEPYAVCPYCQGTGDGCRFCGGGGVVTKFQWDRQVPSELKGGAE